LAKSREEPGSSVTSNERPRNRQGSLIFPINVIQAIEINEKFSGSCSLPQPWHAGPMTSGEGSVGLLWLGALDDVQAYRLMASTYSERWRPPAVPGCGERGQE